MKNILISIGLILALKVSTAAQVAQGGVYRIEQSVIASGGSISASGDKYTLDSAIGEAVAGTLSTSSLFAVNGGFFAPAVLVPTAASVSIGGRARTVDGRGIRNAIITLTTADGTTRTTLTGTFGNYTFTDVTVGQTVILSATGRRYVFQQPVQVLSVADNAFGIDFIAFDQ